MTKGHEKPNSSTSSSILDKRRYDREISFHNFPEEDVPLYTDQSQFIHKLRPQRFASKSPERDVCTQDLRIGSPMAVCWILLEIPCP